VSAEGDLILLEEQDRARWNRGEIAEGVALAASALRMAAGPYGVQAAIAAVHAQAARAEQTDWAQIAGLYDVLLRLQPSPVVELNRAVAVAMAQGCEAGLQRMEELGQRGALRGSYLLPAARADLLRRLERWTDAAHAYREALALVAQDGERRFLMRRLAEVQAKSGSDDNRRDETIAARRH
jgi:RNA polymerase sigma-70 factor (ECF subfamily)